MIGRLASLAGQCQVPPEEQARRRAQYRVRALTIPKGMTMQVERAGFEPDNHAIRLVFAVGCPYNASMQIDLTQDDARSLIEQLQAWLQESTR